MGLHMTRSEGLNVVFAARHRSIHSSVTISLPANPTGASSRGHWCGMMVKLREASATAPGRGFLNIKPAFLVITFVRAPL